MLPTPIFPRFEKAKGKYTIRPYHPKDREAATQIFIEGMYEYYEKNNVRTPLPSLDAQHSTILHDIEDPWAIIFAPYVDWAIEDDNMNDIENYWSLPRRSIFLVAVDNDTNQVVGTVAIQPGTFLNDDWVQSKNMNYLRGDCEVERLTMETHSPEAQVQTPLPPAGLVTSRETPQNGFKPGMGLYSQFMSLCQYSMGSLPNDFYRLDDPFYDEKSYVSLPTVILPDLIPEVTAANSDPIGFEIGEVKSGLDHSRNAILPDPTHPEQQQQQLSPSKITITPPRSTANVGCQCVTNGHCGSKKTALKASRMSQQSLIQYITSVSSSVPSATNNNCENSSTSTKNLLTNYTNINLSELDLTQPIKTQPQSWDSLFCSCVRQADGLLNDAIVNARTQSLCEDALAVAANTLPCPYCIDDARFFVTPFGKTMTIDTVLESNGLNQQQCHRQDGATVQVQYALNPILSTYPNYFTSSNIIPFNQPEHDWSDFGCDGKKKTVNKSTQLHTTKLPFWTFVPNGFYRRFQYGVQIQDIDTTTDAQTGDEMDKTSRPVSRSINQTIYPAPLPVSLTSTTYLDFLLGMSHGHQDYKDYFQEERGSNKSLVETDGSTPKSTGNEINTSQNTTTTTEDLPKVDKTANFLELTPSPSTRSTRSRDEICEFKECSEDEGDSLSTPTLQTTPSNSNPPTLPGSTNPLDPFDSANHNWQDPPRPHPQPQRAYDELIERTGQQGEEHNLYLKHIAIKPSLQSTPFMAALHDQSNDLILNSNNSSSTNTTIIQLPFSDMAEFRRMSVHRAHRSTGLGYLLLITALEVATTVFKFRSLHLTTSRIMDMATRFYHRCGFREALSHMIPEVDQFAVPTDHFCWDLAQRRVSGELDWFSYTYSPNDSFGRNEQEEAEQDTTALPNKTAIFVHAQTLPGDHFDQAARVGDTFLGRGVQQNMTLQDIATKLRHFEAGEQSNIDSSSR